MGLCAVRAKRLLGGEAFRGSECNRGDETRGVRRRGTGASRNRADHPVDVQGSRANGGKSRGIMASTWGDGPGHGLP